MLLLHCVAPALPTSPPNHLAPRLSRCLLTYCTDLSTPFPFPMQDAESMQRRWLRLPPAIRDHPMWAAAQVVAEAQTKASRAAAAGEPWTCPGCGCASSDRVAGPCGLQFCAANCAGRYTGRSPPGGAVAVAAAVTAPPAGAVAAAAAALGGNPSPTPSPMPAQKRRKQATPRSAADSLLSPLSLDSSGDDSSSMQAYSWQSAREGGLRGGGALEMRSRNVGHCNVSSDAKAVACRQKVLHVCSLVPERATALIPSLALQQTMPPPLWTLPVPHPAAVPPQPAGSAAGSAAQRAPPRPDQPRRPWPSAPPLLQRLLPRCLC